MADSRPFKICIKFKFFGANSLPETTHFVLKKWSNYLAWFARYEYGNIKIDIKLYWQRDIGQKVGRIKKYSAQASTPLIKKYKLRPTQAAQLDSAESGCPESHL